MRSNEEIVSNIRIYAASVGELGGHAHIELPTGLSGSVIWGRDEAGFEHVSVSDRRRGRLPSWQDMCRVKDIFWPEDEECAQFHPRESEYVHSVGGLENVLHIWRPKDGDWSIANSDDIRKCDRDALLAVCSEIEDADVDGISDWPERIRKAIGEER